MWTRILFIKPMLTIMENRRIASIAVPYEREYLPMDKEILIAKLLNLAEGRDPPETWRNWTLSVRSKSECSDKSKMNSRPTIRSYSDATPSFPKPWLIPLNHLMRSSLPPLRNRLRTKKKSWASHFRLRYVLPTDSRNQCVCRCDY